MSTNKQLIEARVVALREEGLTLKAIGDRLLAEGFRPPRATTWSAASILYIHRRATNTVQQPTTVS